MEAPSENAAIVRRGYEAFNRADTGGTFKALLQDLFTSDDGRVIALHRNTGRRSVSS